jgi:hypothetical protein
MKLDDVSDIFDNFDERIAHEEIINSQYMVSYPILLEAAQNLMSSMGANAVVPIAHIAYGWMPTILKRYNPDQKELTRVFEAKEVGSFSEAKACVTGFNTSPINNSIVGLSKVLHFINPHYFPIWDSRVAIHFGIKNQSVNSVKKYHDYLDIITVLNKYDSTEMLQKLVSKELNFEITKTRSSELILFSTRN